METHRNVIKNINSEIVEYMTTSEAAEKWCVCKGTVANYCRMNRVEGCKKEKGQWCIPREAIKPLAQKELSIILIQLIAFNNGITSELDISQVDRPKEDKQAILSYLEWKQYIQFKGDIYKLTQKGLNEISKQKDSFLKKISWLIDILTKLNNGRSPLEQLLILCKVTKS